MDDLSAPLGQNAKRKRAFKLPAAVPRVVAGAFAFPLLIVLGWILSGEDPMGGEPVAVVGLRAPEGKPAQEAAARGPLVPGRSAGPRRYDGPDGTGAPADLPAGASGTRTVTVIDGSTGKRQEIVIPAGGGTELQVPAIDQRVIESSRHGPIPRVGDDGTRASQIFAQPAKVPKDKAASPRIAILITGLGIGASSTAEALAKLPPAVSLAFAPYGTELELLAGRARAAGHEVVLQAPMEPFDYPDNDPGPRTLLTSLQPDQNIDRLHWIMSRFQGYVGVTNYMGSRFTATEQALGPVLREIGKRGLIYIDDGTSSRSLAAQIAGASNIPFAKADLVIDAVPTPAEIDGALSRLEAIARERGTAVGVASALPVAIERIAGWAKQVEQRNIVLVPISAAAAKPRPS